MTIQTNTPDRKALAKAIAEELGTAAKYMGMPSCGYQIGDYIVDRDGNIHGEDFGALHDFLLRNNYITEEPEPAAEDEISRLDVSIGGLDLTVDQLKNLTYMLFSKQYLLRRMTNFELPYIPESLVEALKEYPPKTVQEFLCILFDSRANAGLDGFDYRDGKFTLSFPCCDEDPVKNTVFIRLAEKILRTAMEATRIHPEKQEPENEKYFARAWLIRMGYGGADLKADRNILLNHLNGHSAFPDDEAAQKHKDKYAAIRRKKRLMTQTASEVIGND